MTVRTAIVLPMAKDFGDARLEEFKLLLELAHVPLIIEPASLQRTPRRDMIAYLLDAGYVNHLAHVALSSSDSSTTDGIRGTSDIERKLERERIMTLFDLFKGQQVHLTISHRGRVRLSELNQQLKTGRVRDPLGVLIDGRHLDNDLQMARYAASVDTPLSVVFSDMNGMKAINDTFSHAAGDVALRAYFDAVASVVQNLGEAYRRGGDEVVTLLPSKNAFEAAALFDTICKWFGGELVRHGGQELPRLSLSVGIVTATNSEATVASLLERADREMYRAKSETRREPRPSAIAVEGEIVVRLIGSERSRAQ